MLNYAKVHPAMARRGYEKAMNEADDHRRYPTVTTTLTVEEFLADTEEISEDNRGSS